MKEFFRKIWRSARLYYWKIFITHIYKKVGICLYNPLESLLLISATLWIRFYFCLPNDLKFGLHSSWPSNNDENSIYLPGRFILRFMKCFSKNQKRLSLLFCFKNEEIYRGLKNIKRKKIIM